jgi:hypothetical protein
MLALLVLVSSTSFMVGLHFCMGEVKSVSLFSKADQCRKATAVKVPSCHKKNDCCQDQTVVHDGEDFKSTSEQIECSALVSEYVPVTPILISEVIPSSESSRLERTVYDPPAPITDLTVSLSVFLI